MARLKGHPDPPSPYQLKKNVVKIGPPLTNTKFIYSRKSNKL